MVLASSDLAASSPELEGTWSAMEAAARELELSIEEAQAQFEQEEISPTTEAEAEIFAQAVAGGDALLAEKCKLVYVRSRKDGNSNGRRQRFQSRREQDAFIAKLGKNTSIMRCKDSQNGGLAYLGVQYVLKAVTALNIEYVFGCIALVMFRRTGGTTKRTFANIDFAESLQTKLARGSELYSGDLDIVTAHIMAVFAHETSQEDLRRELQSMHHDSEKLIEHFMTLFRQSFEPNVNIENIIISSAVDRIKQMWTFEQREWSIQTLYVYLETTFRPLRVLSAKKWEDDIMKEVASMIHLGEAQTRHKCWPEISQFTHLLERRYSYLGLSSDEEDRRLCSPSVFLRAVADMSSSLTSRIARARHGLPDARDSGERGAARMERDIDHRNMDQRYSHVRALNGSSGEASGGQSGKRFPQNACYRCGRLDHIAPNCTATEAIDGKPMEPVRSNKRGRADPPRNAIQGSGAAPAVRVVSDPNALAGEAREEMDQVLRGASDSLNLGVGDCQAILETLAPTVDKHVACLAEENAELRSRVQALEGGSRGNARRGRGGGRGRGRGRGRGGGSVRALHASQAARQSWDEALSHFSPAFH